MFNFIKKQQPKGKTLVLKVGGMHCTSCAMNIDDALEEIEGVMTAQTHYAKGTTTLMLKPGTDILPQVKQTVETLGYHLDE